MSASALALPVLVLVLFASVLHATWNAILKGIDDKLIGLGLMSVSFVVVGGVALPITGLPSGGAIAFAVASTLLHLGYDLALVHAYRLGDFGHVYPLARGSAPVLVALGAWVFAGERLGVVEGLGVCAVALGLASIVLVGGRLSRADLPATVAALVTGVAIAGYSLVDGIGSRRSGDALGYIALLFLLEGVTLIVAVAAVRWRDTAWRSPRTLSAGLTAGVISAGAYGIVVWAQTRGALAVVSALRESGVIVGAIIGAVIFREHFGWRRLPGAVLVVVGIVLTQV